MGIPVLIIPVLNRFDLLNECIASIDHEVENLLIIDNSNSYEMPHGLYEGKHHILRMPSNMGVAGSWNLGIKCYPLSPYWVIGSNDSHWEPGSLAELEKASSSDALVFTNAQWNSFSIGSKIVQEVGLFDENYYPAYYEDRDYESRIEPYGKSLRMVATNIPVAVKSAATTVLSDERLFEANKRTNESNYNYWQAKFSAGQIDPRLMRGCYDLARRIRNNWPT